MTRINKVYIYYVYEGNEIVYAGLKFQVCEFLKCLSIEIDEAVKKGFKISGYSIKREETTERYVRPEEQQEEKPKKTSRIKYLEKHLEEFGNTVLGNMPEKEAVKILNKLEQETGIKTRYTAKRDEHTRKKYYIIEAK